MMDRPRPFREPMPSQSEQELNEWELSEHSGLTSEEQELSRLKNTTEHSGLSEQELSRLNHIAPQSVFYIVALIIVFVLVIVGMVLLSVFHVF